MAYDTLYSAYGYACDVRATYAHLPLQKLWTWITGKAINDRALRDPAKNLLSEKQFLSYITWCWSIIIASVSIGVIIYRSEAIALTVKAPIFLVVWLLVLNRTRSLLHVFHFTIHNACIADKRKERWLAKYLISIPIFHLPWGVYRDLHIKGHHSTNNLCKIEDPDVKFIAQHGFYVGMPEREFWLRFIFVPFFPNNVWLYIKTRLETNFVHSPRSEVIPRTIFWLAFFVLGGLAGALEELAIFYLFPLIFLAQHSSWIQRFTEHLWFADNPQDIPQLVFYGSLTWGRFQGRPYPLGGKGPFRWLLLAKWWLTVLFIDIPVRLYVFMLDLPSHDFHHRSPRTNFWDISSERAAAEGRPSKFGPMTETWSIRESLLILRDHFCRGMHDPFGVYGWCRKAYQKESLARSQPGNVAATRHPA